MAKFSPKYREHVSRRSKGWQRHCRLCKALFLGRDALLPILPAHHVDHLHYGNLGAEIPFLDTLPLHRLTHSIVTFLRRIFGRFLVNLAMRAVVLFYIWFLFHLLL